MKFAIFIISIICLLNFIKNSYHNRKFKERKKYHNNLDYKVVLVNAEKNIKSVSYTLINFSENSNTNNSLRETTQWSCSGFQSIEGGCRLYDKQSDCSSHDYDRNFSCSKEFVCLPKRTKLTDGQNAQGVCRKPCEQNSDCVFIGRNLKCENFFCMITSMPEVVLRAKNKKLFK
jgi:hypothetical protein